MNNNFKNCQVISMSDFIKNYLDVSTININIDHINHYDITQLNIKGVKRVPDHLVTLDDINTGRVILVRASGFKHKSSRICAYLRPDLVLYEENPNNMSKLDKMIINSLYKKDVKILKKTI